MISIHARRDYDNVNKIDNQWLEVTKTNLQHNHQLTEPVPLELKPAYKKKVLVFNTIFHRIKSYMEDVNYKNDESKLKDLESILEQWRQTDDQSTGSFVSPEDTSRPATPVSSSSILTKKVGSQILATWKVYLQITVISNTHLLIPVIPFFLIPQPVNQFSKSVPSTSRSTQAEEFIPAPSTSKSTQAKNCIAFASSSFVSNIEQPTSKIQEIFLTEGDLIDSQIDLNNCPWNNYYLSSIDDNDQQCHDSDDNFNAISKKGDESE